MLDTLTPNIIQISVDPAKKFTTYEVELYKNQKLPFLQIDMGSYIMKARIHHNFPVCREKARHLLAIGRYSSLSWDLNFVMDLNHEYKSVAQGELSFLPNYLEYKEHNPEWDGGGVA